VLGEVVHPPGIGAELKGLEVFFSGRCRYRREAAMSIGTCFQVDDPTRRWRVGAAIRPIWRKLPLIDVVANRA